MNELSRHSEQEPASDAPSAKVEMYTGRHCGYCVRAKQLLQAKGVTLIEHAVDGDEEIRREMAARTGGRRTLPQIFINGRGIGGFMELYQLDRAGRLDDLLSEDAPEE